MKEKVFKFYEKINGKIQDFYNKEAPKLELTNQEIYDLAFYLTASNLAVCLQLTPSEEHQKVMDLLLKKVYQLSKQGKKDAS